MSQEDIRTFLKLDATGSEQITGIHSLVSPGRYQYKPPRKIALLERAIIQARATGNLAAEKYATISELTNGMILMLMNSDGTDSQDLTSGLTIKCMADWGRYCYDVNPTDYGIGDNFFEVRWTFAKDGQPLRIDGRRSEYLELLVQDDLSALVAHTVAIKGVLI